VKIREVEIHHLAEDDNGSIIHAVLSLTLDDGTHHEVEVTMPSLEVLAKAKMETP
jgi:hypothetical protein